MKSKVIRILLSLALALGIWLYVVTVIKPESEVTIQGIPIMLEGENTLAERDLVIVSNKNFTADLKLLGNRVDLNKLSASNIVLLADLTQITGPGEHNVRYSILYPNSVQPGNIDPLERDPQYITLEIVEWGSKEVPVRVNYGMSNAPEGYVADRQNPHFDHDTITVSGPKEALEHLHHARIDVDLTDKVSDIVDDYRPVFCDNGGVALEEKQNIKYVDKLTSNVNFIHATIQISRINEVPLVVEVIPGGGLTAEDIQLDPSLTYISVSGSDEVLAGLDKIVVGTIHLSQLLESTEIKFMITMPEGVENVTGVTQMTVSVTLLRELETRSFTVNQIRLENVPGNRAVKLVNQAITVQIRGTKEALDALKPEDIVAIVDCTDVDGMSNTTTRLDVVIRIESESDAGAIGAYSVVVEVTEISSGTGG